VLHTVVWLGGFALLSLSALFSFGRSRTPDETPRGSDAGRF
jgi:hypothetical protein